jgi:hypothetical protein
VALRAFDWNCDNLFVAHSAAIETTTCGTNPGFDLAGLTDELSNKSTGLANTTA